MQRRLTTILAADIVGFSRLVGADEEGVVALRRLHRDDIFAPLLARHGGRVANTAGDSWLIEFTSTVEALRFAIEAQARVETMNAEIPEATRIRYRVGINLGDVVTEGDDLLGEGVNIAARLEALAPPGGIVISRSARDQVRDRVEVDLHDLGRIAVKNIARPVHVFQVLRPGEARIKPPAPAAPRTRLLIPIAGFAIALAAAGLWWNQRPDFAPVDPNAMELSLPTPPSIAVLPFSNLDGEASADWISDGITENIISTLSLSPDVVVMGRATSFSYKGKQVSPGDVARELGVRYILSGSVLQSGGKARITAELSDALKGQQLWSLREDSDIANIFEVQDRIAEKLFLEMQIELTRGEMLRNIAALSGDFETSIRVLKGRAAFQRFDLEGHREAEKIWTELNRVNPDSPMGPYLLAWLAWQRVIIGIAHDPTAEFAKSRALVAEALAMQEWGDPYTILAVIAAATGQYDDAIAAANRALELSPGSADVNSIGGLALYQSGEAQRGLDHMLIGLRLEPDFPEWLPGALYPALLEAGRYDEAITLAQAVLNSKEIQDVRAKPAAIVYIAAAYSLKGDLTKARKYVTEMMRRTPDLNVEFIVRDLKRDSPRPFHQTLYDTFVTAGVPRASE